MDAKLEKRLVELRAEYESGQNILKDIELKQAELENRKKNLSETLLRISGAIELLEEVLGENEEAQEQKTKKDSGETSNDVEVPNVISDVEVPNVIRQPLEKAQKTIEEAGFSIGEVTEHKGILPIGVMVGEVLRQDPKPGTKLPAGEMINLIVASKAKIVPPRDRKSSCRSFSDPG